MPDHLVEACLARVQVLLRLLVVLAVAFGDQPQERLGIVLQGRVRQLGEAVLEILLHPLQFLHPRLVAGLDGRDPRFGLHAAARLGVVLVAPFGQFRLQRLGRPARSVCTESSWRSVAICSRARPSARWVEISRNQQRQKAQPQRAER
jgi:hypothetical protein